MKLAESRFEQNKNIGLPVSVKNHRKQINVK